MNVFEDLISELKEENLLESTVMDTDPSDSAYDFSRDANGEHKTSYDLPESIDEGNEPPVEMMPIFPQHA